MYVVCYQERRAEAINSVLSIKSHKSAWFISDNFHYQNYFGWNQVAIDLFYTQFIVGFLNVKLLAVISPSYRSIEGYRSDLPWLS